MRKVTGRISCNSRATTQTCNVSTLHRAADSPSCKHSAYHTAMAVCAVTPAPSHSMIQCCTFPFGFLTVNLAVVSLSAIHIAVLVCRLGSPQDILEVPLGQCHEDDELVLHPAHALQFPFLADDTHSGCEHCEPWRMAHHVLVLR